MLVRSRGRFAVVRPRHAWMALMVDECAGMPLTSISAYVQHTFEQAATRAKASGDGSMQSAAAPPAEAPSSSSQPTLSSQAPADRAHAWVAVARLLCESGDWARAAAVVSGLPAPLQQPARFKALRDDWPLPRTVAGAWRRAAEAVSTDPAIAATGSIGSSAEQSHSRTAFALPAKGKAADSSSEGKAMLASYRKDELMRLAYSLRRPAPSSSHATTRAGTEEGKGDRAAASHSPATVLRTQQHAIIDELHRRGAVAEALQCIVNWQRRQLVLPDMDEVVAAAPASAVPKTLPDGALLDGVSATKLLLFPSSKASGNSLSRTTAYPPGAPQAYSTAQLARIREATVAHPALVARCVRDRAVVDRLLLHIGDARVAELALSLLHALAGLRYSQGSVTGGGGGAGVAPQLRTAALVAPAVPSPLDTYWRAIAALLSATHSYWRNQPKAAKGQLLRAVAEALQVTQHIATNASSGSSASSKGDRLPAASFKSLVASPPLPSHDVAENALTSKCRHAIKATVESTCSPLLHHEPQIRFLRLAVFGRLALLLTSLRVAVPNALAQCLFHCMADGAPPPSPGAAAAQTASLNDLQKQLQDSTTTAVQRYLAHAPGDRWAAALEILQDAHRNNDFRVTPAHERAVLSGLQSISITHTWPAALRTVSAFADSFGVRPDERTLPTLLLNLKQHSWQEAFRVLEHCPGGEPSNASPLILRDLQLVALKHAAWEVPLRLMTFLQERQADGFMNYLYCVCAAARGGQAEAALQYFFSLKHGRGRHVASQSLSPFNELTVAVAAVAMLDGQHAAALQRFCAGVLSTFSASASGASDGSSDSSDSLTPDGRLMTLAGSVAAHLMSGEEQALTSLLQDLPESQLQSVLRRVAALYCLMGMAHLQAPVRLVFDVLGAGSSPQQQRVHRAFLHTVEATQQREGTFETRQRSTTQQRRPLFIPVAHQRQQKTLLATQLGTFVKHVEASLSPSVVRCIAETMVGEGVGAEYMTAALL